VWLQCNNGVFSQSVDSDGEDVWQLEGLAVAPDETRLLVCDGHNSRVVVASADNGRSRRELRGPEGTLHHPIAAIVVPLTGQVLVLN
jgi:hypothetical protein